MISGTASREVYLVWTVSMVSRPGRYRVTNSHVRCTKICAKRILFSCKIDTQISNIISTYFIRVWENGIIDGGQEGQQFSRERSMTRLRSSSSYVCRCIWHLSLLRRRVYEVIISFFFFFKDLLLVLGLRLPLVVTEYCSNARAAYYWSTAFSLLLSLCVQKQVFTTWIAYMR